MRSSIWTRFDLKSGKKILAFFRISKKLASINIIIAVFALLFKIRNTNRDF